MVKIKPIPMHGSVLITHRRYLERMQRMQRMQQRIQHRAELARIAIQERRRAFGIEPIYTPRTCEAQRRCMLQLRDLPPGVEDSVMEAVVAGVLDSCLPGELSNWYAPGNTSDP